MDFSLKLSNYSGPLDCFLALVQREEIDICEVPLQHIIAQYRGSGDGGELDSGAEFIAHAAALLWIKSRRLLPAGPAAAETPPPEEEPMDLSLLQNIVAYRALRDGAAQLAALQQQQEQHFYRGAGCWPDQRPMGIEQIDLGSLAELFGQVLARARSSQGTIVEEEWRVADKMGWLRGLLAQQSAVPFLELFAGDRSRLELIVIFLALLELIKNGQALALLGPAGEYLIQKSE